MESKSNINQKPEHSIERPSSHHYEEDEVNIIAIVEPLWKGRKSIFKTTIIFACIGLFVALTTPAQYTSSVVVKPILSESKSSLGSSLGGLAAMAGITLPSSTSSSELHPSLYPQIIESYGYRKALMQTKLSIKGLEEEISYEDYFLHHRKATFLKTVKKYTLGIPGLIIATFKSTDVDNYYSGLNVMTENDLILMKLLSEQFKIEVNEKGGYVSLSAIMPEPVAATQMILKAQNLLQKTIIAHKAKKAKEDLIFIEERYAEKKAEFDFALQKLAIYRDANRNVNTAIASTERERLESEYQLAFSVYSELAKQVETQKIKVKEDAPVFAILKEAVVPLEKSGISKLMILVLWTFFGVILGISLIHCKMFLQDLKMKWNKNL